MQTSNCSCLISLCTSVNTAVGSRPFGVGGHETCVGGARLGALGDAVVTLKLRRPGDVTECSWRQLDLSA